MHSRQSDNKDQTHPLRQKQTGEQQPEPQSQQQQMQALPSFTSPPLNEALLATPIAYQADDVIDAGRAADAAKRCNAATHATATSVCQIPFVPDATRFDQDNDGAEIGVILYGGALVDPRSYSPLAKSLSDRFGIPVVVPIFHNDLAFTIGSCDTGRIDLAHAAFPSVKKWVLVGHSFGGIAAMSDLHARLESPKNEAIVGGLVMLAVDVRQDVGCGAVDFSQSGLPMASLTASKDERLNITRWNEGKALLPSDDTLFVDVLGGNHAQFGSYNDTSRRILLNQTDGDATISHAVQQDFALSAIHHVVSRTGLQLPKPLTFSAAAGSTDFAVADISAGDTCPQTLALTAVLLLLAGFLWKKPYIPIGSFGPRPL